MSCALDEFQELLLVKLSEVKFSKSTSQPPALFIPAKSEETGPLWIYDDDEEYTIAIGELHHSHFSAYNYNGESLGGRMTAAANDAANFVADILQDRICFIVHYKNDECIGSTCCPVDEPGKTIDAVRSPDSWLSINPTKSVRFVWSGCLD